MVLNGEGKFVFGLEGDFLWHGAADGIAPFAAGGDCLVGIEGIKDLNTFGSIVLGVGHDVGTEPGFGGEYFVCLRAGLTESGISTAE